MSLFNLKISVVCQVPAFSQINPNSTELCTNGFYQNSTCDIGSERLKCICDTNEVENSFYAVPDCNWVKEDILTTTTESTTNEPSTSTFSSTTSLDNTCNSREIPNGYINCNKTTNYCQLSCDIGFAPIQTKCQSIFYSKIRCDRIASLDLRCIPIEEICHLEKSQYENDPSKHFFMVYKLPVGKFLGGVIYGVQCANKTDVFEFSGKNYEKLRCVCKIENGAFICRRSRNYGSDLGKCVKNTDYQSDQDENQNIDVELNLDLQISLNRKIIKSLKINE